MKLRRLSSYPSQPLRSVPGHGPNDSSFSALRLNLLPSILAASLMPRLSPLTTSPPSITIRYTCKRKIHCCLAACQYQCLGVALQFLRAKEMHGFCGRHVVTELLAALDCEQHSDRMRQITTIRVAGTVMHAVSSVAYMSCKMANGGYALS